jgi:hypothetical protein
MKYLIKTKKKPKIICFWEKEFQEFYATKIQCFFRIIIARKTIMKKLDGFLLALKIRCSILLQCFARSVIAKKRLNELYIQFVNNIPFKYYYNIREKNTFGKRFAYDKSLSISKRLVVITMFKDFRREKGLFILNFILSRLR